MSQEPIVILCPGQGAQAVGMGKAWRDASDAAANSFKEADEILADSLGAPLSELCFDEIRRAGKVKPGDYVMFIAIGGGLTWTTSVWKI